MQDDLFSLMQAPPSTAQPGLHIRLPDAEGHRRIEWFGEEIGCLVPEDEGRWTGRMPSGGADPVRSWQPLPLHDAAAALLGLWVRTHGVTL